MTEPQISFDPALPITEQAPRIAELIRDHQVVVVAGETGSGKTTQLPKICLLAGRQRIAHTQPRRIAARTVAVRIAQECQTDLGEFVGYQVRFTRKVSQTTRIKVMTDGVLLSELSHDRDLRRYDTIIIDEAHERSLNIDFLLGYLKQLLPRRPELRVIVTSATIDTARFSTHFNDAPVIEVSGRTYPVELRYQPVAADSDEVDAIAKTVAEIAATTSTGDVLVFLTGEREIRDAAEAIEGLKLKDWQTLPLYARLAAADQQQVFQAHTGRRVVLATNVAETSITVPGIRYVIDTGLARISRYSARTKVQRLPIEPVSQASANQRAGRCGRLGPGIAIRLYSEEDFEARPEFTEPEILRTNLATVILQMAQAGLGDIESFPFIEAPVSAQIADGLRVLHELGAIKSRKRKEQVRLTRIGRLLARMPVDPRLGRMLIEGSRRGCLRQVQVLVAGLTVPDVRERPAAQQHSADELHRRFISPPPQEEPGDGDGRQPKRHTVHTGTRPTSKSGSALAGGDFEALMNVWDYLRSKRRELGSSAFRKLCRNEFLHFVRFREWGDLVAQLREVCRELDLPDQGTAPMTVVLDCLLTGLLSHIGLALPPPPKVEGKRRALTEYQGARGARFAIAPGSACARNTPPLVVAYELVETSRLWARTVAPVTAAQIVQAAGALATRTVAEPSFSPRSATVVASETISVFGVPIIAGRRTNYAATHPEQAREIFIRSGLVEGQWVTRNAVVRANQFAMAEAERLTDRMRRPDLLIGDQELYDFYDARLPQHVVSGATFERHLRDLDDDSQLRLSPADCMSDPSALRLTDFPDRWSVAGFELPISYVYDPGAGHDGVSIEIRLEQLSSIPVEPFSWQVPGLREALATALIRTLPKKVRTAFVPAPDFASRAVTWLTRQNASHDRPFTLALGEALTAMTGNQLAATDWRPAAVDTHLRPTFVITDGRQEVARGEDLSALKTQLAAKVASKLTKSAGKLAVTGQSSWSFGELPRTRRLGSVAGYPYVTDEGNAVGVAVADSQAVAERLHAAGLRRLLTLVNPSPIRWVVAHLSHTDKLAIGSSSYPSVPALLADAWLKANDRLLRAIMDPSAVRDEHTFTKVAEQVRADCPTTTAQIVHCAATALATQARVERQLAALAATDPLQRDIAEQIRNLTFDRFISATPDPWFDRIPVWLQGCELRLTARGKNLARDERHRAEIAELEDRFDALCDAQPPGPLRPEVEEIAFLLEELRLSLFAQGLRTVQPVSVKRLNQALERLGG